MCMILNKGYRIRASDKHLVYYFSIGTLLFVPVAVFLLLNVKQLMGHTACTRMAECRMDVKVLE